DRRYRDGRPHAFLLHAALGCRTDCRPNRRSRRVGAAASYRRARRRVRRLAWLAAVRAACEEQRIGWALWGYDDSMGLALQPPGRSSLDSDVLRALGL